MNRNGPEHHQHFYISISINKYSVKRYLIWGGFLLTFEQGKENCQRYKRQHNGSDNVFEAIFDLTESIRHWAYSCVDFRPSERH